MTKDKERKLLIISDSFPPLLDASAVLMNNIFSSYKGNVECISGTNFTKYDSSFVPPCKTRRIVLPQNRFAQYFVKRYHYLLIPFYYYYILFLTRYVIKPSVIMGNWPNDVLFVCSYKVAKKLGIPFFAYMHDLWEENILFDQRRRFAQKWEKEILLHADKVICCTVSQQEYYLSKYNLRTSYLPHPIPDNEIIVPAKIEKKDPGAQRVVAFSGSISSIMNLDAFRMLRYAFDYLPDNYIFRWYPISEIDLSFLKKMEVYHPRMEIIYVDRIELKKRLNEADVLFAPLSHKNCSIKEVKTVFSNKLLGYLVSGKPVLVFGPPDCHHVQLARSGDWGYIVDEDSSQKIADAIITICNDAELSNRLIINAFAEAERRRSSYCAGLVLNWVNEHE